MDNLLSSLTYTFVAVVDNGSITQAADQLNMAKSSISQNLKTLESSLKVKLIHRTTRRQTLTPAGEQYYHHCRKIIAIAKTAREELQSIHTQPSGPIKVTAPHAMIKPIIAPALAQLVKDFPTVTPHLFADDLRLDLVANGLDVAITVGELPDSSYYAQRVGYLESILCASPRLLSHYGLDKKTVNQTNLSKLPFVSHHNQGINISYQLTDKKTGEIFNFSPNTEISGNSVEAITAMVREGIGAAVLPNYAVADDIQTGNLIRICASLAFPVKPIHALHHDGKMAPKAVSQFISEVSAMLNTLSDTINVP